MRPASESDGTSTPERKGGVTPGSPAHSGGRATTSGATAGKVTAREEGGAPQIDAPGNTVKPAGRYARFLDLVERLDSFPLHLGTHLGGFVIADRPITYYAPLQYAAKQMAVHDTSPPGSERQSGRDAQPSPTRRVVVTQLNKDDIAALGLVKMDILGLRTHSAVSECVHLIRQRTGRRLRPYELPPDDPAAYEVISNGGSIGLFQLESANAASRLKERDFDDVIAAIALYRPGPFARSRDDRSLHRPPLGRGATLPHPLWPGAGRHLRG